MADNRVEGLEIGGMTSGTVKVDGHQVIFTDDGGDPPTPPKAPKPPKAPRAPKR